MATAYEIRFECNAKVKEGIESILGISSDPSKTGWTLTIEEDSEKFTDALDIFIDLISQNQMKLELPRTKSLSGTSMHMNSSAIWSSCQKLLNALES